MSTLIMNALKVFWVILAIAVVAGIIIFLILRSAIKKAKAQANGEQGKSNAGVKREDISSYIMFEDIRDGIVILDNYHYFVAAIEIQGYDLYHAATEDQQLVMSRYTQLFDMLNDDEYLQMRYCPQLRDLSQYVENYTELYESVSEEIYTKYETIQLLQQRVHVLEKDGKQDTDDYGLYIAKINALQKEVMSLTSQKDELDQMVRYCNGVSGEDAQPDMRSNYCFAWEYNEMSSAFEEHLTKEQIFERAKTELQSMANSYICALAEARVRARQVKSTTRMLDIYRRYFRPQTGGNFNVETLLCGSVMDYVTASERDMTEIPRRTGVTEAEQIAEAYQIIGKEELKS